MTLVGVSANTGGKLQFTLGLALGGSSGARPGAGADPAVWVNSRQDTGRIDTPGQDRLRLWTLASFAVTALALHHAVESGDTQVVRAINILDTTNFPPAMIGLMCSMIGVGVTALEDKALPNWLAWGSIVIGGMAPLGPWRIRAVRALPALAGSSRGHGPPLQHLIEAGGGPQPPAGEGRHERLQTRVTEGRRNSQATADHTERATSFRRDSAPRPTRDASVRRGR